MRNDPSYMILPKHLRDLVRDKNKARKLHQKTKSEVDKKAFNALNNEVRERIAEFRRNKWINYCNSLNNYSPSNTQLWNKIKSIDPSTRPPSNSPPTLVVNNVPTNSPQEVADIFATQLEHVFTEEDDPEFDKHHKSTIETQPLFDPSIPCEVEETNVLEIEHEIKKIRARGSPGEDSISNKVLKCLPQSYLQLLADICNASLRLHHIPESWKLATIIMIPKPLKDPSLPDSYRPISLLNTLSKLLERIVLNRLLTFINLNNIMNIYQSGFRKYHQTKDQILRLIQAIRSGFNRNLNTGAVFIDIEKAFDKVWHRGLLYKLKNYNFPNYLGLWIENYLTDRKFKVRIGTSHSTNKPIKTGVPQGSVLGPVLFNIFFNDIETVCKTVTEMALFADDLSAWYSSVNPKMIQLKLQIFLDNLHQWLSKWRLKLSIKKTVVTIFNPAGRNLSSKIKLAYNSKPINYEPNPKFLGVTLDPKMSFVKYAETIKQRTTPRMNMLRHLRGKDWGMNTKLQLITYKALIRSLIDYAPQVTLAMSKSTRRILETIQSKAIRQITRWPTYSTNKEMLKTHNIEEILPRAFRLVDNYFKQASHCNPLIRELINSYNIAPELEEGLHCKLRKPHLTPIGFFKQQNSEIYKSVKLFK